MAADKIATSILTSVNSLASQNATQRMFKMYIYRTALCFQSLLWYIPASGIPWAFCARACRTSLADTKKMRSLAWALSTTPSSSTRKLVHLSICCLRTWHSNNSFFKATAKANAGRETLLDNNLKKRKKNPFVLLCWNEILGDQTEGQEVKRKEIGGAKREKEGEREIQEWQHQNKIVSAVIEHQMTALTHTLKMSWNGLKLLPWMMRCQVSYPLSDPWQEV